MKSEPKWTRGEPKRNGWYWARREPNHHAIPVVFRWRQWHDPHGPLFAPELGFHQPPDHFEHWPVRLEPPK